MCWLADETDPDSLLPSPEVTMVLTSQGFGTICLMMTPALLHVEAIVAPAPLLPVAVLALAPTALKPAVKTWTLLEPGSLGIFLPQPCSSTAGSSATRTFLDTSGASSKPSASNTDGF
jgi:hypothetical protein